MDIQPKPAWLTTEFWLTTLPTILFLYKMFTGKDVAGIDIAGLATVAAGIATAGYAISRAITKRGVAQAQAMVAGTKLSISYDREMKNSALAAGVGLGERVDQLEAKFAALENKPRRRTVSPDAK